MTNETAAPAQVTNLAALRKPMAPEQSLPAVRAGFNDLQGFELMQRQCKALAASTLVPQQFQGNMPNCLIALEMAQRSRFVGKVMPEPLKVAETVAKTTGAVVQIHGAEAARRLELTTQVPTQSVFVTSGPSKRIRVGKMEIRLQHVCQRKLALAGRPAGLALAAMWYLGKKEVTPALVEKIRRKLGSSEFEVLKSATSSMPAWMSDAIFRNERMAAHA